MLLIESQHPKAAPLLGSSPLSLYKRKSPEKGDMKYFFRVENERPFERVQESGKRGSWKSGSSYVGIDGRHFAFVMRRERDLLFIAKLYQTKHATSAKEVGETESEWKKKKLFSPP